jgi:four helix bundle protein
LKAFRLAHDLALLVYQTTSSFPGSELYGLVSQMRRAAVSTSANIVERCARHSEKQYNHFLDCSFGSLREVGYYIALAEDLGYLKEDNARLLRAAQSRSAAALGRLLQVRRQA